MRKDHSLTIFKKNPFFRVINFFKSILTKKIFKTKVEKDEIAYKDKKREFYIVEYDTDPSNTDYGDIYYGNKIIRNTPYVKEAQKTSEDTNNSYSKEEKDNILKKYKDYVNNNINAEELGLDEIIMINKLLKEELKIRKNNKI